MPAMELLCQILDVNPQHLTKHENLILEAELFYHLYGELKDIYRAQFIEYFKLMRYTKEMEDTMIEANFLRCLIQDIVTSEAYTLAGIAFYTNTPEDLIYEIASGQNTSPSLKLSREIIELHRSIRPDLYKEILKKIA